jgi:hypothetical protein
MSELAQKKICSICIMLPKVTKAGTARTACVVIAIMAGFFL